ncbi:MAG: acyl-CoA dehydratase activase [Peptococcaceae bacterium]|jgi:predicted CoA-substrate-specific enzyme activase|nr:acyl-CoA dehydratase activase [Peptococcaceae bacterium]
MFFAGIDIGSTITKIVIREDGGRQVALVRPTGAGHRRLADRVMEEALEQAGLTFDRIAFVVATGYGRVNVPFADAQLSEITCHMKGVNRLFPGVRTIIDIGGQDSKGIKVVNGKIGSFVMNDKCAAGTGRFLEVMADSLGLGLEETGEMALVSRSPVSMTRICTAYVGQEIVLRMSEGVPLEDIVAGVHQALCGRICSMVNKIGIEKEVVLTGGGAKNPGVVKYMEKIIGFPLLRPAEPLLTGALGASLAAQDLWRKAAAEGRAASPRERTLAPVSFFQ